jgi:Na+/phosphate symporter
MSLLLLLLLHRFLLTTATHRNVKPLTSAAAAADAHSAHNLFFFFFFFFFFTPLQNVTQKLQFPGTSRAVGSRLTATAEFPSTLPCTPRIAAISLV